MDDLVTLLTQKTYPRRWTLVDLLAVNPRGDGLSPLKYGDSVGEVRGTGPGESANPTAIAKESFAGSLEDRIAQGVFDGSPLSLPAGAYYAGGLAGDAMMKAREGDVKGALSDLPELAIFAGPGAKTANLGALSKAKAMTAKGISRSDIWRDTGWYKHPDTGWRNEIDDSAASLSRDEVRSKPLSDSLSHDELYAAYPDMKDISFTRSVPKEEGRSWFGDNLSGSYMDAMVAPGLEKTLGIKFQPEVSVRARDNDLALSGTLHELQHAVQSKEGFARGGSPLAFSEDADMIGMARTDRTATMHDRYVRLAGEVEARNVQMRRKMSTEERRLSPPWETQDVPDAEQTIRGNKTGTEQIFGGRSGNYNGGAFETWLGADGVERTEIPIGKFEPRYGGWNDLGSVAAKAQKAGTPLQLHELINAPELEKIYPQAMTMTAVQAPGKTGTMSGPYPVHYRSPDALWLDPSTIAIDKPEAVKAATIKAIQGRISKLEGWQTGVNSASGHPGYQNLKATGDFLTELHARLLNGESVDDIVKSLVDTGAHSSRPQAAKFFGTEKPIARIEEDAARFAQAGVPATGKEVGLAVELGEPMPPYAMPMLKVNGAPRRNERRRPMYEVPDTVYRPVMAIRDEIAHNLWAEVLSRNAAHRDVNGLYRWPARQTEDVAPIDILMRTNGF